MTHPQEGGTGGEVSEILFFSAKSKRRPSLIYSMQIIPVCLYIVVRRKGVFATRRGGLNWTPISLLVGHPCKLFHRLHTAKAHALGVDPESVSGLETWQDQPGVSLALRSALNWAETTTLLHHESDTTILRQHYSDTQITDLTVAFALMNGLIRLAIALS